VDSLLLLAKKLETTLPPEEESCGKPSAESSHFETHFGKRTCRVRAIQKAVRGKVLPLGGIDVCHLRCVHFMRMGWKEVSKASLHYDVQFGDETSTDRAINVYWPW